MMRILPLLALAAACGSSDICSERPVTFSYIYNAIIVPNCATSGCHSQLSQAGAAGSLEGIPQNFNNFNIAYSSLGHESDFLTLVKGASNADYRMPPDQPLPKADIDLIQCWNDAGNPK